MQASRDQDQNAAPLLIASSHTLTGVMPGQVARHSFAERVAATAGTGFDALCIHWRDHARLVAEGADPGAMRAMMENAGLVVPEVEFVSDWHPWNDTGVDSIKAAIGAARLFGAGRINVGADLAGQNVPLAELLEPFRRMCGMAAEAGLIVSLELLGWGRMRDLDSGLALIAAADGNAGLLIDIWHVMRGGRITLDGLKALDPALVAGIQINDAGPMTGDDLWQATMNRTFPGHGEFDVPGFLRVLWPAALRTGISVEIISESASALPLATRCARAATSSRHAMAAAARAVAHG